jgi:hypothetical protein
VQSKIDTKIETHNVCERVDIKMELNENGNMTVNMVGHGDIAYEIEKPEWLSSQGWKELVGLFPNEKISYNDVLILLAVLGMNIVDGKDTGKDLIHSLQLSIVSKLFEIDMIQDLIKSSEFYKSGEMTNLVVDVF